jgi:hypothetical protein
LVLVNWSTNQEIARVLKWAFYDCVSWCTSSSPSLLPFGLKAVARFFSLNHFEIRLKVTGDAYNRTSNATRKVFFVLIRRSTKKIVEGGEEAGGEGATMTEDSVKIGARRGARRWE